MSRSYKDFLDGKSQLSGDFGFKPSFMPYQAFGFQKDLINFACKKGRTAIFADCGLGKTFMQLVWAQNVLEKTNKNVLIMTPIAVGHQTLIEASKFGIEATRSNDGKLPSTPGIVITNYERLHYFDCNDFAGIVCDESSILKNFDGTMKANITEFMRTRPYRLLCTATAAPNDFLELGTSSEAIGELGFMDMQNRFFRKVGTTSCKKDERRPGTFVLRDHAQDDFWRWVCSWARAIRRPSDLGYEDKGFDLPKLITRQHVVTSSVPHEEYLFTLPASGLAEQRAERSRTINERCQMAADLINSHDKPAVAWCHLNGEGDRMQKLIPGCVQVSGKDSPEHKEECFKAFESGEVRVMVTKPSIAGFGLNWQHCNHQTFFPSHSFEQWYQSIRRCWRFGQTQDVTVDVISSEGESRVLANLQKKSDAASIMYDSLVRKMWDELKIEKVNNHTKKGSIPKWI
jgi:hypothetical protein